MSQITQLFFIIMGVIFMIALVLFSPVIAFIGAALLAIFQAA